MSVVNIKQVMDLMGGKLKEWDNCRCGMLVGKAIFYETGTSSNDFKKYGSKCNELHVVLPLGADAKMIRDLIENAISGAEYCDPKGVVHKANRAQISDYYQDNMSRGFFLFLTKVEESDCCDC